MKLIIGMLFITLLVGCGNVHEQVETPEEFRSYFEAFDAYAEDAGSDARALDRISVEFGTYSASAEGNCHTGTLSGRSITIDATLWASLSEEDRQVLILHELGHCVLNRRHDDTNIGSPIEGVIHRTIMNSHRVDGHEFENARDYYLTELFQ